MMDFDSRTDGWQVFNAIRSKLPISRSEIMNREIRRDAVIIHLHVSVNADRYARYLVRAKLQGGGWRYRIYAGSATRANRLAAGRLDTMLDVRELLVRMGLASQD